MLEERVSVHHHSQKLWVKKGDPSCFCKDRESDLYRVRLLTEVACMRGWTWRLRTSVQVFQDQENHVDFPQPALCQSSDEVL